MKKLLISLFFVFFCLYVKSEGKIIVTEIMSANIDQFLSPATNFDGWIELYNPTSEDFSLKGHYVSDNKVNLKLWQFPDSVPPVPAKGYSIIWFGSNKINSFEPPFKLDVNGGSIFISSPDNSLILTQDYPEAIRRTSYSLKTDGTWGITCNPTPGYFNSHEGYYTTQLEMPEIDAESQLFTNNIECFVKCSPSAKLIYTTDGSLPTIDNGECSSDGHFVFTSTTILRVRSFRENFFPSDPVTRSFIKKEHDVELPIISVVTQDNFLNDDSIGIMIKGVNGIIENGSEEPCNWNMDWERPAYFSLIKNGYSVYDHNVNLEVTGGWSRNLPVKSIKLKGNKLYGEKNLNYSFFSQKPYIRNRTILLRNGGAYMGNKIKDASLQTMIYKAGLNVDVQAYEPIVYYLNGKCLGVMNLREPHNKHYVYANYGLDDDEIDMIEMKGVYVQLCGDSVCYDRLYKLSYRADEEDYYKEIQEILDEDNYLDYLSSQLYLCIPDGWPRSNSSAFRSKDNGKFRHICYDLDGAFLESPFPWLLDKNQYGYQTVPKSTTIFVNLLKNQSFRRRFIDKFCIMGGAVFNPLHAFPIIDTISNTVFKPLVLFGENPEAYIQILKNSLLKCDSMAFVGIKQFAPLSLDNSKFKRLRVLTNIDHADVFLNKERIPYSEFEGRVYLPATISSKAPYGFVFEGWKVNDSSELVYNPTIEITDEIDIIMACFKEQDERINAKPIVINEVCPDNDCYINDYYKKSGWLELYNTTSKEVDIKGMFLSDDCSNLTKYKIEGNDDVNTIVSPYSYIVLWADRKDSKTQLHLPFKLNKERCTLYLTPADGTYTDTLVYNSILTSKTIGRYPDGCDDLYIMKPSIGCANLYSTNMAEYDVNNYKTSIPLLYSNDICSNDSILYREGCLMFKSYKDNINISIYNSLGSLVFSDVINPLNSLPINSLPNGIYLVKVKSSDGRINVCKFIKK